MESQPNNATGCAVSAPQLPSAQVPPPSDTTQRQPPPPRIIDEPKPTNVAVAYDHERATWGLGDFVVSLIIYFAVGLGLAVLIYLITGSDGLPQGPWLLLAVVGPQAAQFLHLLWVSRKKGTGFGSDFQFRFSRPDLRLGLGLFLMSVFAAGIVALGITALVGETPDSAVVELAQDSSDGAITIWILMFALLGATFIPLAEELVFRGLLWGALEKRGMRPMPILFLTSAIFAMLHLEPWRTPVLFVIGLAIGYGRMRTGRIGTSLVVHGSINASAMLATVLSLQ